MKHIAYITNASRFTGVGSTAHAMRAAVVQSTKKFRLIPFMLDGNAHELTRYGRPIGWISPLPGPFNRKSISWLRLSKIFIRHIQNATKCSFDAFHATNQTLSFLSGKLHPFVLTVHDIIEITSPQNSAARFLNMLLYRGIDKADKLITVSHHTKKELCERYSIDEKNVSVIYNGIGRLYRPIPNVRSSIGYKQFLHQYDIQEKSPIVLYVGSEHPRKNIAVALEAFARSKKTLRGAVFIKVGNPGLPEGRAQTLDIIRNLAIEDSVRFIDGNIEGEILNLIYNIANVLIYPSLYEGFGMPPLEAMAAGTPVITSNATSLPEIVGDNGIYGPCAAIVHDPHDVDAYTQSIVRIIGDPALSESLSEKGQKRSKRFSWGRSAKQLINIYDSIM